MKIKTPAFCYSKALFESDLKNHLNEKRLEELECMLSRLNDHPSMHKVFHSSQIETDEKLKLVPILLGREPDKIFLNFIKLLLEKNRFCYFKQIVHEYRLMFDRSHNIWEVSLITAIPVEKVFEGKIRLRLEKYYNKKIKIKNEIDPKVIGAAIIILDNKMIDWSVAGRLKAIKEKLLETGL